MKLFIRRKIMLGYMSIVLSMILGTSVGLAQSKTTENNLKSKGVITVKNEAFVKKIEKNKNGKEESKMVKADKVKPGEEVVFVLTAKNNGREPATNVLVTNPIPANMTYKSSSAENGETIEFSVDGGKEYGSLEKLSVKVLEKNKKELKRPATPADVTHVQWRLNKALEPNKEVVVKLVAILN